MTAVYTAEPLPGIRQVGETAPTSKRKALSFLRTELGITGAQAHALFVAYERDVADALRVGNDTERSDADFIDWLRRQAPGGRRVAIRKHEWRVSS